MRSLTLQLDRDDAAYIPGELITGHVAWDLTEGPERLTIRLIWQTSGKGTQDVGVVSEQPFELASLRGSRDFSFEGIDGPYSFSGKLITVAWVVEAVVEPGGHHAERSLTLSPTGFEVRP